MTAVELYEDSVKPLPMTERLKLAQLILNNLELSPLIDDGTEWSEEDYQDFSRASWQHINMEPITSQI